MRADRLLAILLLLQRGRKMTAAELARRLEVSERTIYRDVEALGTAGVPVYAEPGRGGGIRLLEGYRTDLTGLSPTEAELLPLLGLTDVLAGIGMSSGLERTQTKVLMALTDDQRERAERSRRKIHVDLSRWWEHAEETPYLAVVADAVLSERRLKVTYRRGGDDKEVRRTVAPCGLVVQGGTWYLVATVRGGTPRIYRVSRLVEARVLEEATEAPEGFDLAAFWAERKEEFHMTRPGYPVSVRARGRALVALNHGWLTTPPPSDDEWVTTDVSFPTRGIAFHELLGLGPQIEVLAPSDLRDGLRRAAAEMLAVYEAPTDGLQTTSGHADG